MGFFLLVLVLILLVLVRRFVDGHTAKNVGTILLLCIILFIVLVVTTPNP